METKEYRTVDKSAWPRGEWDDEPDKMQFPDEATGLPCLIVRNPGGALCGYVGVSARHPCFGKDWHDDNVSGLEVHGGITFGDHCQETDDESKHICHVPANPAEDGVWWLGFDCAHCWDVSPKYAEQFSHPGDGTTYKSIAYVKNQIRGLAQQLASLVAAA